MYRVEFFGQTVVPIACVREKKILQKGRRNNQVGYYSASMDDDLLERMIVVKYLHPG